MDAEAPTLEQQRRWEYEVPQIDQRTNRQSYSRLSPFEKLRKSDEITVEMLKASDKYAKHYWGALGHDVRSGDGYTDDPLEYPAAYHGQQLAKARAALILPSLRDAIESQVEENMSLVDLGQYLRPVRDRAIARNVAVTTISTGLEILSIHWGFQFRPG